MLLLLLLSRFSRVRLCATPWTAAHQAPPPMGFSRQEYWSGLPLPSPRMEKTFSSLSLSITLSLPHLCRSVFLNLANRTTHEEAVSSHDWGHVYTVTTCMRRKSGKAVFLSLFWAVWVSVKFWLFKIFLSLPQSWHIQVWISCTNVCCNKLNFIRLRFSLGVIKNLVITHKTLAIW